MSDRFKWRDVSTHYRETRASAHGEELRWLLNRETILDTATGNVVTRAIIRHPGISVVVPFLDDGRIVLVRQYRYSLDGELWELPAGTLEGTEQRGRMVPSETALSCAARELAEETGYVAGEIEEVASCYAMPGSSDEVINVFFARDLKRGEQSLDVGETIDEVRGFDRAELHQMLRRSKIRDAKTLIGLFYALSFPALSSSR